MLKVKQNECIACGLCVSLCPDVFTIDETGRAEVISDKNLACARQAANSCPVKAIEL
jgi:ferredoxin